MVHAKLACARLLKENSSLTTETQKFADRQDFLAEKLSEAKVEMSGETFLSEAKEMYSEYID